MRRKTSQELASLMWEGQEVSVQTPDSSKYISNRGENNEERCSEDRFVDKPNLLIIPDAEDLNSIWIWVLLSGANKWQKRPDDVEWSHRNKSISVCSWEAEKVRSWFPIPSSISAMSVWMVKLPGQIPGAPPLQTPVPPGLNWWHLLMCATVDVTQGRDRIRDSFCNLKTQDEGNKNATVDAEAPTLVRK